MKFVMSALLTVGSTPNGRSANGAVAPIHGFTYAEENDEGVNWHISEFFTDSGASWSCLLPDIAIVEGVLFVASYICGDPDADDALGMIAAVMNGDVEFDETIGERAIELATRIVSRYHWTLTRWPNCEFFYSHLLLTFPYDTIFFLDALDD